MIFIAKNNDISEEVIKNLNKVFEKNTFKITSRTMSIQNTLLSFLDVEHVERY